MVGGGIEIVLLFLVAMMLLRIILTALNLPSGNFLLELSASLRAASIRRLTAFNLSELPFDEPPSENSPSDKKKEGKNIWDSRLESSHPWFRVVVAVVVASLFSSRFPLVEPERIEKKKVKVSSPVGGRHLWPLS